MKTSVTNRRPDARITNHRLKSGAGYACCLLAALNVVWYGYQRNANAEKPRGAVHTRTAIARRALEIGIALNGSAQLLTQPALQKETIRIADETFQTRNIWVVLCESEHRQMNMLFDDETGRLSYLVMDAVSPEGREQRTVPRVETEAEAISISVARLKALQVLPRGAQIALREKPQSEFKQLSWNIHWLVWTTPAAQPYTIKIVLNCNSSLPTYMVDLWEKI